MSGPNCAHPTTVVAFPAGKVQCVYCGWPLRTGRLLERLRSERDLVTHVICEDAWGDPPKTYSGPDALAQVDTVIAQEEHAFALLEADDRLALQIDNSRFEFHFGPPTSR